MTNTTIPLFAGGGRAAAWSTIALLLTASPAPARAQDETFAETTSVVVIEVPVQVVDRDGNPVRGLSAEHFEIYEGRRQRELIGFEVIDRAQVSRGRAARAEVPPSARRHFLFLFDLSFSDPSSILKARDAARQVLDDLHPTDLTAVATYSLLRGAEVVLGFTSDRRQTDLAIDTLGAPQLIDRSPDPLGILVAGSEVGLNRPSAVAVEGSQGAFGGGRGSREQDLAEYLQDISVASDRMSRQAQAQRVQQLVRSMAGLAELMRSMDGRKYVVYLSEGFDSGLLVGETPTLETNRAIESGEIWNVESDEMYGSGRLQNQLEAMLEEFRRADCTVQAVDIGGLRAADQGPAAARGQEGLFAMARGTGGDLYRNFNDLGEAMGEMLESTGVTYVLAFQPDDLEADGSYHRLRVRLKDGPPGARIIHRPGYFAPRAPGEESPQARRLQLASRLLAGREGGGVELAALPVPVSAPGGRARVPVFVEIDGASLLGGSAAGQTTAEIYAYALDAEGAVEDYFSQSLGLDLERFGEKVRQGGIRFLGWLDLAPGRYDLRILVRNSVTGSSGLQTVSLDVPAFGSGELAVLPPLVPETDLDRWLMVQQAPAPGEAQPEYPFTLAEGESFVPVARPVVPAGRPVRVGIFAYNAGSQELTVNAQLLDAGGYVVLGQQLPVHQRLDAESGGPTRLLASLQVAGVPDGEYTLSVGVLGPGGRRDLSTLPVRVIDGGVVGAGLPATIEPPAVPPARASVRQVEIKAAYRAVLTRLSEGLREDAAGELVGLEVAEAALTDDVLLKVLQRAELEVAERLAAENPDALTPVILLHMDTYLRHRDADRRLLARHSRSMVRDLAELYVEAGGSPTSVAADVFTSLGGALQQSGLTASANALFERALDLEGDNRGALLALACYYEKIGEYERAVSYLERLVEAHPDGAEGWLRLGINLHRLGRREPAVEWLVRAQSEAAPAWIRSLAYQELASLRVSAGDLGGAERVLRRGLEIWPSDQRLRFQLGHVLDRGGNPQAAAVVISALEPSPPGAGESPRYLYNRWPSHALESDHMELVDSASSRLGALAAVISGLSKTESAR